MQCRIFLVAALALGSVACASSPPPDPDFALMPGPPQPPAEAEVAPQPAGPKRPVPEGQIRREDVMAVLSDGPPAFLRRVEVEPSLDGEKRFRGWEVKAIRDPELAAGGVQQGDIVMRVNGQAVEDPYQFFDVFQSLAFAPELRLSVERAGQRLDLRYPINDDPSAPKLPLPEIKAPPAPPMPGSAVPPPPPAPEQQPAPKKKGKGKKKNAPPG